MSNLAYTPDLFAEPAAPMAPAKPADGRSDEDGYYVPCGNIHLAEWREYDEELFAGIRRLLSDGPKDYADLNQALGGANLPAHALNCHLFRMQRTGEISESPRYITTSDARDPAYRGWTSVFSLAEVAE